MILQVSRSQDLFKYNEAILNAESCLFVPSRMHLPHKFHRSSIDFSSKNIWNATVPGVSSRPNHHRRIWRCVGTSAPEKKRKFSNWQILICGIIVGVTIWKVVDRDSPSGPRVFVPTRLKSKKAVSSASSIFTLALPSSDFRDELLEAFAKGVWSVQVMQPQLQVARSYTPFPPLNTEDSCKATDLRFLIRREPQGEVSRYLHSLSEGATINLRGPHLEYAVPEDVNEVVFVAGGTGIAPALQVVHTLFESRGSVTPDVKMHILWANRERADVFGGVSDSTDVSTFGSKFWTNFFKASPAPIKDKTQSESSQAPVVQELDSIKAKYKGKLTVDYFVDEERSFITEDILKRRLRNPRTAPYSNSGGLQTGKKLILISGPEGFVTYFAGTKTWAGGIEAQGSVGGVLNKIKPYGWEIWKL